MTADIALVAMTIVALASLARDYRLQMKIADRMRVVSPPKTAAKPDGAEGAAVEELLKRRAAS